MPNGAHASKTQWDRFAGESVALRSIGARYCGADEIHHPLGHLEFTGGRPHDSNAEGVPDDSATPLVSRIRLNRLPRVACGDT
jgi:hypothetical protein